MPVSVFTPNLSGVYDPSLAPSFGESLVQSIAQSTVETGKRWTAMRAVNESAMRIGEEFGNPIMGEILGKQFSSMIAAGADPAEVQGLMFSQTSKMQQQQFQQQMLEQRAKIEEQDDMRDHRLSLERQRENYALRDALDTANTNRDLKKSALDDGYTSLEEAISGRRAEREYKFIKNDAEIEKIQAERDLADQAQSRAIQESLASRGSGVSIPVISSGSGFSIPSYSELSQAAQSGRSARNEFLLNPKTKEQADAGYMPKTQSAILAQSFVKDIGGDFNDPVTVNTGIAAMKLREEVESLTRERVSFQEKLAKVDNLPSDAEIERAIGYLEVGARNLSSKSQSDIKDGLVSLKVAQDEVKALSRKFGEVDGGSLSKTLDGIIENARLKGESPSDPNSGDLSMARAQALSLVERLKEMKTYSGQALKEKAVYLQESERLKREIDNRVSRYSEALKSIRGEKSKVKQEDKRDSDELPDFKSRARGGITPHLFLGGQ